MSHSRKSDGVFDDLYHIFLRLPVWICLPLAGLTFFGVNLALNLLAASNALFRDLPKNGTLYGGMFAALDLLVGRK
jgi:hypothetical protein